MYTVLYYTVVVEQTSHSTSGSGLMYITVLAIWVQCQWEQDSIPEPGRREDLTAVLRSTAEAVQIM